MRLEHGGNILSHWNASSRDSGLLGLENGREKLKKEAEVRESRGGLV